jgi:hypothetical protein
MTLRHAMTYLLGLGSFLAAASSCAAPQLPGSAPLRDQASAYQVEVLIDGMPAPTYAHDGETYVLGQLGARYTLRISNRSGRRIEAVASVDGRDVIDGRPADFRGKRGYMIPAWGQVDIDGWRISRSAAAAFRFSSVPDSYAARTGSAREVGVIGVAVFPERYEPRPPPPRPYYRPFYDEEAPRADNDVDGLSAPDAKRSSHGAADAPAANAEPLPAPAAPPTASEAPAGSAPPVAKSEAGAGIEPGKHKRSGLGTEYGEAVSSPIYEVEFVRANPARPSVVLGLRYNDRDGLLAMGIDVDQPDGAYGDQESDLRRTAEPFPAAERRYAPPPAGWRTSCCLR